MKKILSLVLALALICAMATTAFAANYTDDATFTITTSEADNATGSGTDYTWNIDVSAKLEAEEVNEADVAANYYVVVSWDVTSELTYKIGSDAYSWNVYSAVNEETGEKTSAANDGNATAAGYEVDYTKGVWDGSATVKVTVENWSNRTVTAEIAFDPAEKNDAGVAADITVKEGGTLIDKTTMTIDAASKGVVVGDDEYTTISYSDTATVTLDGTTIEGGIDKDGAVIGTVTVTLVGLETASESTDNTASVTPDTNG